jgi:hypothetical protein
MCFDFLELCHGITMERLLHFFREESVAFSVEFPPCAGFEHPIALVGEKNLERIGIGERAEANKLCKVENDGFGLDFEGA